MGAMELLHDADQLHKNIALRQEQARVINELNLKMWSQKQQEDHVVADKADMSTQTLSNLKEEIDAELGTLSRRGEEILSAIQKLEDPTHRTLLTLRYVFGMRWKELAERMHYSTRHLSRIHHAALDELALSMNHNGETTWKTLQ